ncbi:prolactin-3B1-like [Nannospalax galili]|uniref:prolactin-3B1-like n=1 Tax=Nannospalax galili TaxID=1026970 RepID=UPI0004ED314C|nr:prolactin-3B1-like [Nannospalax galili]
MKLSLTLAHCSGTCLLLLVSNLLLWENVASMPQTQLPAKDLYGRVIFLSHCNHNLATQVYFEFVEKIARRSGNMGMMFVMCHTASIPTPENREQVQRTKTEDLLKMIIRISLAWEEPLKVLGQELAALPGASDGMLSNIKTLEERNEAIVEGTETILSRLQPGAVEKEYVAWSGKNDLQSADARTRVAALRNVLRCLRRDTHKIDNFFKVLKCRVVRNNNS